MTINCATGARRLRWALTAIATLLLLATTASGQTSPNVVRIEEDWELVIATPDTNSAGPQITMAFSPFNSVEGLHATFELNHRTYPGSVAGGMQLQMWYGEYPCNYQAGSSTNLLNIAGETITWTQVMEVDECELVFKIENGQSQTWGNFGGNGSLERRICWEIQNLNSYNVNNSVTNSGVGYAGKRVQSLVIKRYRAYTADGTMVQDTTPRVVHSTSN